MRLAMKASREAVARRLATTPATVEDLETGSLASLPHWKETARIVRSYCEWLRVDAEPILWRLRSHLDAAGARSPAPTTLSARMAPAPPRRSASAVPSRSRPVHPRRRRRRRLLAFTAPLVFTAGLLYLTHAAPQLVYGVLNALPTGLAEPVRGALDYLLALTAPRRDGLRWIEVGDPRVRKSGKLSTGVR
jgi:hypothetical protein